LGFLAKRRQERALFEAAFRDWLRGRVKATQAQVWEGALSPFTEGRRESSRNLGALIKRVRGWVWTCVSRNGAAVARVPLRLYVGKPGKGTVRGYRTRSVPRERVRYFHGQNILGKAVANAAEVEEITEHPILDLLRSVNPIHNAFDFLELTSISLETGDAFWLIVKGALETPEELWPLQPQYVDVIADRKRGIGGYKYGTDPQNKKTFKPEEVIHFMRVNLKTVTRGSGGLQAGLGAIDLNQIGQEYERGLLDNHGVPRVALMSEHPIGEVPMRRLKREFRRLYQGSGKYGTTGVLAGGVKIERLALSPTDLDLETSQLFTRAEVAAVFDMPLSMLQTENVNRANAETGRRQWMETAIAPRCVRIQDKLNERLVPLYDEKLFLAFDNPVPEDRMARLKEIEVHLKSGYSTPNEERGVDGWEPRAGGDEVVRPAAPVAPGGEQEPEKPEKPERESADVIQGKLIGDPVYAAQYDHERRRLGAVDLAARPGVRDHGPFPG